MHNKKFKNFVIRIVSSFILSHAKRKKFRNKFLYLQYPDNNKLIALLPNGREKTIKHKINNLNVNFIGKNNCLKINPKSVKEINITFNGNNGKAEILTDKPSTMHISIGENGYFYFGENSYCMNTQFIMTEDSCKIIIGNNCAISWNTEFLATDCHTIINKHQKIINRNTPIIIHDHVWIGCNVKITKGVEIASDNIIGMGTIISRKFNNHNCIIAGNPAKIIKNEINWDVKTIDDYQTTPCTDNN